MKRLFDAADRYIHMCDWKDLALVKFCLFSIGLMCGLTLKGRARKTGFWAAAAVFAVTYIPLMSKFLPYLLQEECRLPMENGCKNPADGV